jgi:hypothetical protein
MPRPYWWSDWSFIRYDDRLSILDVLESGTLDTRLAGLLWLLMEHRASLLVASGPVYAGKTTLLHSLLDFLPPGAAQYPLQGYAEDFAFVTTHKPDTTYLVSEEISNHQYEYLWGQQVRKTFRLLPKGYRFGATIHARDVRETAYVLRYLDVPLHLIAELGIVVTLQARQGRTYEEEDIIRRIDSVSIIGMEEKNLVAQTLAARESLDGAFEYPAEPALRAALARKFGYARGNVFAEVAERADALERLRKSGPHSREDVQQTIAEFYKAWSG